jgi:hypothetical protein
VNVCGVKVENVSALVERVGPFPGASVALGIGELADPQAVKSASVKVAAKGRLRSECLCIHITA